MKKQIFILILIFGTVLFSDTTYYVSKTGSGTNPTSGELYSAYGTISDALNNILDGDTIMILGDTGDTFSENLFLGKNNVLITSNNPDSCPTLKAAVADTPAINIYGTDFTIKNLIIDCNANASPGIKINSEAATGTINNVVIYKTKWDGLECYADGTIIETVTINNSGYYGLKLSNVSNIICNNIISYSNAHEGIQIENSDSITLLNIKVYSNSDKGVHIQNSNSITLTDIFSYQNSNCDGMGIENSNNIVMTQSILYNNTYSGIYVDSSNVTLNHVTITKNKDGIFSTNEQTFTVKNCIIYGNSGSDIYNDGSKKLTLSYSLIEGWHKVNAQIITGQSVILSNPWFVNDNDINTDTFLQLNSSSQALDSGDPSENNTTLNDTDPYYKTDMGAVPGVFGYEQGIKLESFDYYYNQNTIWSGDKYYSVSLSNDVRTFDTGSSMKVTLNRTNTWDLWGGGVLIRLNSHKDFSQNSFFTLDVYGKVDLFFKFEDRNGYREDINNGFWEYDAANDNWQYNSDYIITTKNDDWNRIKVYYSGPNNPDFQWKGNDGDNEDNNNEYPDGSDTDVDFIRIFFNSRNYTNEHNKVIYLDNLWLGSGAPDLIDKTGAVIDDFDDKSLTDNNLDSDALWGTNDSTYIQLNIDMTNTWNRSKGALKVDYNLNNETSAAFIASGLNNEDNNNRFNNSNKIFFKLFGQATFQMQLEDINGNKTDIFYPTIPYSLNDKVWNTVQFSYLNVSRNNCNFNNIDKIIIIITDTAKTSGTIYIDNLWLGNTPPVADVNNVTLNFENVVVYPNPYNPNNGTGKLYFTNVPENSVIKIFNLSGILVSKITEPVWNGMNMNNERVGTGLYVYYIKYNNRKLKTGKIIVNNK